MRISTCVTLPHMLLLMFASFNFCHISPPLSKTSSSFRVIKALHGRRLGKINNVLLERSLSYVVVDRAVKKNPVFVAVRREYSTQDYSRL